MTPQDRRYSKSHEWVKIVDGVAVVGITDHAQNALGDITYVELPKPGQRVGAGRELGVIESVKAASELYAPISGSVQAVNDALNSEPERINRDPYGDGWIVKLSAIDPGELNALLEGPAYESMITGQP